MGKPQFEINDQHLAVIERMAGLGSVLDDIAYVLGCSPATLDRLKNGYTRQTKTKLIEVPPDERVALAYNQGRALAKEKVQQKLMDLIEGGDVAATIFWLKAQAGWSDRVADQSPAAAAGNVVIYLPDNGRDGRRVGNTDGG